MTAKINGLALAAAITQALCCKYLVEYFADRCFEIRYQVCYVTAKINGLALTAAITQALCCKYLVEYFADWCFEIRYQVSRSESFC